MLVSGQPPQDPAPSPEPQPVLTRLTEAAVFLVLTVNPGGEQVVRDFLPDLAGLQRAVGFRIPDAALQIVAAIGSDAWDRLFAGPRPRELHPFRELAGPRHVAPATPGDLLFHIRASRMDLCFAGGSYVIVQKYLHDVPAWNALTVEEQERVIGRTKLTDIELPDDVKPANSHVALNTLTGPDGTELQIVRANMPFGQAGTGEFGTYYISYAATPRVTEQMLENMFLGRPPGNTDRILDFSTALTGCLFFAPPAGFLDDPPGAPDQA